MDNVEKRYCMIVECLAASDVYLASGRIAETLQVSAKTVRKDLEKMCPQLEEIGIYIRKKPGLGYFMDAESKAIWRSSEKNLFEKSVHFAKQYRTHYILQRLLSSEAYIKSAELAEELFVSQVAISAELKTIRRYLADYELTIRNTPNHGIRIQGKEQYIRSCMLSEYSCCIDRGTRMVPAFRRLFSLRPSQAGIVKDTVRIFLIEKEGKPYYIHDRCAEQLIYGIALMHNCASRSRQMCFTDKEIYETQLTRSYQAIQQVTAEICRQSDLCFSLEDELYLSNLLLGFRTFLRFDEVSVKENYYRAVRTANQALTNLFSRFGLEEFAYDKQIRERLALYILPLEARLRTHMFSDIAIPENMMRYSLVAKDFSIYTGSCIESAYHCPLHRSELDRLGLIFLPEIPRLSGRQKTECTVAMLSKRYPRDIAYFVTLYCLSGVESRVKQVLSFEHYQRSEVIRSRCDLLLTDEDPALFQGFQGDIIQYPFDASEESLRRIQGWFNGKHSAWRQLSRMFREDLFVTNCCAETMQDAMDLVRMILLKRGYADHSIFFDLECSSKLCISISGNGIAFVKTRYTYGEKSFCGVFQFEKPVRYHGINMHLLFVLSVGSSEPREFLAFNGWVEALLQDRQPLFMPKETLSYQQLLDRLHTYFIYH